MMNKNVDAKLIRTFLATGDARCPLVCQWTLVLDSVPADDSELTWPAAWMTSLRRAIYFLLTNFRYSTC